MVVQTLIISPAVKELRVKDGLKVLHQIYPYSNIALKQDKDSGHIKQGSNTQWLVLYLKGTNEKPNHETIGQTIHQYLDSACPNLQGEGEGSGGVK